MIFCDKGRGWMNLGISFVAALCVESAYQHWPRSESVGSLDAARHAQLIVL